MGHIPSGLSKTGKTATKTSVDEDQLTALISAIRTRESTVLASPVGSSGLQTNQPKTPLEASAIVGLTQAEQVWATPIGMDVGHGTDSLHNYVKLNFTGTNNVTTASANAAFYFTFTNPSPDYVAVLSPPTTNITVSGIVTAQAGQGPWNGASFDLNAYFRLYTPAAGPDSTDYWEISSGIGNKNVTGGAFTDTSEKLNCDVSGQSLSFDNNIELAPGAIALFEVILWMNYSINGDAAVILDFYSSDAYEFSCNEVTFDILTNNIG